MSDRRLEVVLAAKDLTGATFSKFQHRLKSISSSVFNMQTAMVAAAGVAGIGLLVSKSMDAADKIGKVADAVGISTSALQEYRHAAQLSGTSTQALDKSLLGFSKRMGEAQAGTGSLYTYLQKTNTALLDQVSAAHSTEAGLEMIFKAMANTADASDKAALAAAAFGRSGVEMTVMTKNGAAGLNAMMQEAEDLGLVLDESLIRSSEAANDAISRVTGSIKTGFMTALTSVAPQLAAIATAMSDWIKANQKLINQKMASVLEGLKKVIPTILKGLIGIGKAISGWKMIINTVQIIFGKFFEVISTGIANLLTPLKSLLDFVGLESMAAKVETVISGFEDLSWAAGKTIKDNQADLNDAILGASGLDKIAAGVDNFFKDVENHATATSAKLKQEAGGLAGSVTGVADNLGTAVIDALEVTEDKAEQVLAPAGTINTLATAGFSTLTQTADASFSVIGTSLQTELTAVFQGEFDSIGDFFHDLLDSMYSMFVSWAAKVAASKIVMPALGGVLGFAGNAFAGDSGIGDGGGLSNILSLASWGNSLSNLYSNGASYLQFSSANLAPYNFTNYMGWTNAVGSMTTADSMGSAGIMAGEVGSGYGNSAFSGISNAGIAGVGSALITYLQTKDVGRSAATGAGTYVGMKGGAAIGSYFGPWGTAIGGALGAIAGALGVGALFSGKPSKMRMWSDVKLGYGEDGLLGYGYEPGVSVQEYTGKYISGRGPGDVVGESLSILDEAVSYYVDDFTAGVNDFGESLPTGDIKAAYDAAMKNIAEDFSGVTVEYSTRDGDEWADILTRTLTDVQTQLSELVAPTIEAFTNLVTAVDNVIPAFDELMSSLNAATKSYFDPLISIDKQIAAANGTSSYLINDLGAQADVYKTLYDNAVANNLGYDRISQYGQQYASSLQAYQGALGSNSSPLSRIATGVNAQYESLAQLDYVSVLEGIRDDMLESGGQAEDFKTSVVATLTEFQKGIADGVNGLVDAIKEISPDFKFDVDFNVTVADGEAYLSTTPAVARAAA